MFSSSSSPVKPTLEGVAHPLNADRGAVIDDYIKHYVLVRAKGKWSGSVRGCDPGDISNKLRAAALERLNYFRRQVGYTQVLFLGSELMQAAAQESALILRANPKRPLNHEPPKHWRCWSKAGAFASRGNLFRGSIDRPGFAVWAVGFFMEDPGAANKKVGHRSWFLQPNISDIGVGATGNTVTIWWKEQSVLPKDGPSFVSWPPQGYAMDELTYARWSFHVVARAQEVNLSQARVQMYRIDSQGRRKAQPLRIVSRASKNWFLGGLVWEPVRLKKPLAGEADISYEVSIKGIRLGGEEKAYRYPVRLINAEEERRKAGVPLTELEKPLGERKNLYVD